MVAVATERMIVAPTLDAPEATSATAILAQALGEVRRRDLAYTATKRTMDVLVAVTLLLILLPVLVIVAIAIRLETRGPIVYRGDRIGRFGNRFTMMKFRSMRADCDASAHAAFVQSLLRDDTKCDLYKVPQDPRITRVGAFLRRTSLDELPQLWNVLRGDMSLVGPRPDVPYAVENYADWMHRRLDAKPGMTGLWQVSGRSRLSLLEMYRLDVSYVGSASLAYDLRILVRTPSALLVRNGAA
jgi:lipopolysaccharide/colanic/teichoic acid biosynthesis glycosyltransferase